MRRRLAEDRGVEQVSRTVVQPLAEQVDFLRASRDDMAELRRQVFPLARRLATRLTARRQLGRNGKLDFRRTVRASLGTGGVPLVTHHKPHKPHKPELTVHLRRVRVGRRLRALHAAAGLRAARAVHQGAGLRLHRHRRRGDPLLHPRRRRRRRARDDVGRGRPGLVRRAQRLRPLDRGVRDPLPGRRRPAHLAADPRRRAQQLPGDRPRDAAPAGARSPGTRTGSTPSRRPTGAPATAPPRQYAEAIEMVEVRNAVQLEAFVATLLPQ